MNNITTFDNIEFSPLRNYNRCVMLFNLREDSGEQAAKDYIAQINAEDRKEMLAIYTEVKKYGAETIKKAIMKAMPLPEEEEVVG